MRKIELYFAHTNLRKLRRPQIGDLPASVDAQTSDGFSLACSGTQRLAACGTGLPGSKDAQVDLACGESPLGTEVTTGLPASEDAQMSLALRRSQDGDVCGTGFGSAGLAIGWATCGEVRAQDAQPIVPASPTGNSGSSRENFPRPPEALTILFILLPRGRS